MTAQQYQECWRERVEKENKSITLGFGMMGEEPSQSAGSSRAPAAPATEPAAAEKDDDVVSVVSMASKRSVARSDVSSNVSTNSATERKLKLLEQQLEKEKQKRKELEELLKAQKSAPSS